MQGPPENRWLGLPVKIPFFYYYHYYQKYIVRQSLTLVQLVEIVNAILLWIWHGNSNGRIIYLETTLYIKVYLRFFFDNYFVVFFFCQAILWSALQRRSKRIQNLQYAGKRKRQLFTTFYFNTIEGNKSDLVWFGSCFLGTLGRKQHITIHTPMLMHWVNKTTTSTTKTII